MQHHKMHNVAQLAVIKSFFQLIIQFFPSHQACLYNLTTDEQTMCRQIIIAHGGHTATTMYEWQINGEKLNLR